MPKNAPALLVLITLFGCGGGGSASSTPEGPQTPQPSSPSPEISNFTASASTIMEGETVTLLPVFSNGSGQIDNGVGMVTSNESVSVSPAESTTYTLTVTNGSGDSVSASVDITVQPSPITLDIQRPAEGQLAGDELFVAATVVSEFDISTITAEVQDRIVSLVFDQNAARFSGQLSLSGLPSGPQVITVTVEDVAGNFVTRRRSFILDRPPILTVTEPLDQSVARPGLPVEASCSDDLDHCQLTVWWEEFDAGPLLASADRELSETLDLSEFAGQGRQLVIVAQDPAQTTAIIRVVFVEPSPRLTNERQFPTTVIDFDGQRALVGRLADEDDALTIVDVDSGGETIVEVPDDFDIRNAFLSPTGAIYDGFEAGDSRSPAAYDWNNSTLVELSSGSLLDLAGDYAVWTDGTTLFRRQFTTNADFPVSTTSTDGSVASNGVVVFSARADGETHEQIVKFEGGTLTPLTTDPENDNQDPETDGQGAVYRKTGVAGHAIAYHDGTGELILVDSLEEIPDPDRAFPGRDYAIAGGWAGFTDPTGTLGQTHVWTRNPSGATLQRSNLGTDTWIETLAADGEVMVVTGEKRYLSLPTGEAELTEISWRWPPQDSHAVKIGETWYVSVGRSLFEVQ